MVFLRLAALGSQGSQGAKPLSVMLGVGMTRVEPTASGGPDGSGLRCVVLARPLQRLQSDFTLNAKLQAWAQRAGRQRRVQHPASRLVSQCSARMGSEPKSKGRSLTTCFYYGSIIGSCHGGV